ncbi:hypothetical protein [Natronobiforma cellulositropha]|uniref:hypothetical protein n=1 Tax=Natronobiforma cellulositropha TaxID=1679076 RepID=UPI0021D59882|nr:hypothetical protein [Natronobiforma cellulositropha]
MALQRLLGGDPSKRSTLYLVIGGLSLAKAIAVRNDPDRFKRELLDAGLFIGLGLVLRRYSTLKAEKRAEITNQLPDWLVGDEPETTSARARLRASAKRRFSSEPQRDPTLREKAQQAISN